MQRLEVVPESRAMMYLGIKNPLSMKNGLLRFAAALCGY
jgi:hypothetical protein